MTRKECEDRLLSLAQEAQRVYREFNPNGTHLSITVLKDVISIEDYLKDANGNYPSIIGNFDAGKSIDVMHSSGYGTTRTDYWRGVYNDMKKDKEASA